MISPVERVQMVWSRAPGAKRRNSAVYWICSSFVIGYLALAIVLFLGKLLARDHEFMNLTSKPGRVSYIRQDGMCIIGLHFWASMPLIAYDLYVLPLVLFPPLTPAHRFINVMLTALFVAPLLRAQLVSRSLRRLAMRTLAAASAALLTSAANMALLTGLRGHERGWACLASCGVDVLVNAIALYAITGGSDERTDAKKTELVVAQSVRDVKLGSLHLAETSKSKPTTGVSLAISPLSTLAGRMRCALRAVLHMPAHAPRNVEVRVSCPSGTVKRRLTHPPDYDHDRARVGDRHRLQLAVIARQHILEAHRREEHLDRSTSC
jgi:hypothetical protein